MERASRLHSTVAFVLFGRMVLLCTAAGAVGVAIALARGHDRASLHAQKRYVCPMHPEVLSGAPGDCPICGMALELVDDTRPDVHSAADVHAAVETVQRGVLGSQVRAPASLAADGAVTAVLHRDDLIDLAPGDHALYFGGAAPAVGIDVRLLPEPPLPVDASTCKVRFEIDRGAPSLAASGHSPDVGLLQIAARPREVLTVPASAILYSSDGPYVLAAALEGDSFARRRVDIGRILDSSYAAGVAGDSVGAIVVLSGLREGERVITGDTFFLDAQRRLQLARGQTPEVTP